MKKIIAILSMLVLVMALAGCAGGTPRLGTRSSWSGRNMTYSTPHNSWTIAATSLRGHSTRTLDVTAEQLAALHVASTNSGGELRLTITQSDVSEHFDLTGAFEGPIDASTFEPGRISLRLDFERVEDVSVHISWE